MNVTFAKDYVSVESYGGEELKSCLLLRHIFELDKVLLLV